MIAWSAMLVLPIVRWVGQGKKLLYLDISLACAG